MSWKRRGRRDVLLAHIFGIPVEETLPQVIGGVGSATVMAMVSFVAIYLRQRRSKSRAGE
jgi:hypothetical protein